MVTKLSSLLGFLSWLIGQQSHLMPLKQFAGWIVSQRLFVLVEGLANGCHYLRDLKNLRYSVKD